MSVRKIPKSYTHVTGIVSSPKAIGDAEIESLLEWAFYRKLAFDPLVKNFEVQPCHFFWLDSLGKRHVYTPDCRVNFWDNDEPCIYEVKPRSVLRKKWKTLRPAFRAAVHQARCDGSRFKIITEREICIPFTDNGVFLMRAIHSGANDEFQAKLIDKLSKVGDSTPAELVAAISNDEIEQAQLLFTVWHLIGTFQIWADLDKPLSMDSIIRCI